MRGHAVAAPAPADARPSRQSVAQNTATRRCWPMQRRHIPAPDPYRVQRQSIPRAALPAPTTRCDNSQATSWRRLTTLLGSSRTARCRRRRQMVMRVARHRRRDDAELDDRVQTANGFVDGDMLLHLHNGEVRKHQVGCVAHPASSCGARQWWDRGLPIPPPPLVSWVDSTGVSLLPRRPDPYELRRRAVECDFLSDCLARSRTREDPLLVRRNVREIR